MALLTAVLTGKSCDVDSGDGRPLRLAFLRTPSWPQGDADMREAFERLVRANAGLISEVAMPEDFDGAGGLQRAVQFHDIARNFGSIVDEHPGIMSAKLQDVVADGRSVTTAEYDAALKCREPLYSSLKSIFSAHDAILTPASQGVAPEGLSSTGSPMFNFIWTYLGVPAISIPLLTVAGLPLGVQLVGPRGSDARLLGVAATAMTALRAS
jgi:Asp-tRNA(Asn)/Glu-tRNA(Gln) amidotransferase A subunit family amidase